MALRNFGILPFGTGSRKPDAREGQVTKTPVEGQVKKTPESVEQRRQTRPPVGEDAP
jgi:hypothetical protein